VLLGDEIDHHVTEIQARRQNIGSDLGFSDVEPTKSQYSHQHKILPSAWNVLGCNTIGTFMITELVQLLSYFIALTFCMVFSTISLRSCRTFMLFLLINSSLNLSQDFCMNVSILNILFFSVDKLYHVAISAKS